LSWGGFPRFVHPQPTQFRCHGSFALEHSSQARTSLWVVEYLDGRLLDEVLAIRREEFRPDPTLHPSQRAELEDYRGSGWDRGHLAPAADFKENAKGMSQSFYLSNIVPQAASHNRGIWAQLERSVRRWAQQRGALHVWTGPVYNQGQPQGWLGGDSGRRKAKGRVAIPTHLYKIVLDPARQEMVAFVIPNQEGLDPESWLRYRVPVESVEQWTGLRWLGRLPTEQRQQIMERQASGQWF
jgi:endonuclease G